MDKLKKLKFQTALVGAKLTSKVLKLLNSSGTSLPGVVATKADNEFLLDSLDYCNKNVITITGTNGKTTTSGLISSILSAYNQKVLHNQQGANMPQGIASAIALGLDTGKNVDYFVLETDEAYLTKIYDKLKSDYLLVTNLFDDQTDRHGAVNLIAEKIRSAIDKNPDLMVVLNADDVMLKPLYAKQNVTYGFDKIEVDKNLVVAQTSDNVVYCTCGQMLEFSKKFYSHIGHYICPCGYKRPNPDVLADAKIYSQKIKFDVLYKSQKYKFETNLCGIYNAYNVLAAIALCLHLGVDEISIQKGLDNFNSSFGRANHIKIGEKNLYVQMIKNTSGATEGIKLALAAKNSKMLLMINDEYSDGRDMSWLWDVDFDILKNYGKIYVAGKRALDVALRLKYSEVKDVNIVIEENIEKAFDLAMLDIDENQILYALPCYSAMVELKQLLEKKYKVLSGL